MSEIRAFLTKKALISLKIGLYHESPFVYTFVRIFLD